MKATYHKDGDVSYRFEAIERVVGACPTAVAVNEMAWNGMGGPYAMLHALVKGMHSDGLLDAASLNTETQVLLWKALLGDDSPMVAAARQQAELELANEAAASCLNQVEQIVTGVV